MKNILSFLKSKQTFLKSFDIPVKTKASTRVATPRITTKKVGKQKFSIGQIRKQAIKQGTKLSYKVAKKLSKVKQTQKQLYTKIYYQKQKQAKEQRTRLLKAQGKYAMSFVKRYINLAKLEYETNPTKENLKRWQEASLMTKEVRLLDARFRLFWNDIKEDIKFKRQQMRASLHAGNISKPLESPAGTPYDDYVMSKYGNEVDDLVKDGMNESDAIQQVWQNLIASGEVEVLNQYYQTGQLYGYIDIDGEVISPI